MEDNKIKKMKITDKKNSSRLLKKCDEAMQQHLMQKQYFDFISLTIFIEKHNIISQTCDFSV